jgi:hypothetical protein
MKIYRTPEGIFHGRRSEAGPAAEIVEVDTTAAGIAAFANYLWVGCKGDEFTTVVERQDPVFTEPRHVDAKPDLDELFLAAPLSQQLTLAAIAVEEARNSIRVPNKATVEAMQEIAEGRAEKFESIDELFS